MKNWLVAFCFAAMGLVVFYGWVMDSLERMAR